MKVEEYLEFLAPDDIRIKGSRMGIESILYEYIHREQRPEAILERYPNITLEQVYATILYYLQNKEDIIKYMTDWLEFGQRMRAEQEKNPPPIVVKLRTLKKRQQEAVTVP